MRTLILLTALVGSVALAQHAGHDPDLMIPKGNGGVATEVHGAWFVPQADGVYEFPMLVHRKGKWVPVFMAQEEPGPVALKANRQYRLWPWAGKLKWIPPGGTLGDVPPEYILPVDPATVMPQK